MLIFAKGWSRGKDGPGQRLVFYLKGCNLACRYCGNPEGMRPEREVLFYRNRATAVPPELACKDGTCQCDGCTDFRCVTRFHHPSFELAGTEYSPEQLRDLALASRSLFDGGGGVTFGGGEPTLQAAELLRTLNLLRTCGISTAVESNASTEAYRSLVGDVDFLISDCKAVSPACHRALTGVDNDRILSNLRFAAEHQPEFLLRIPLIPGYNLEEPERYREFLHSLATARKDTLHRDLCVQPLRLHHLGETKYRALNREYPLSGVATPDRKAQAAFEAAAGSEGVRCLNFNAGE